MKKNIIAIVASALIVFFAAVAFTFVYVFISVSKNTAPRKSEISIGSKSFSVDVASDAATRAQGLSGRESLGDGEGMYFIFDKPENYGFWMKDMKFAIDIIWIRGNKVVGIDENVEPEPGKPLSDLKIYYPPQEIDRVLEVNAGTAEKYNLTAGDTVTILSP
jgi:uncharacterized membrane protein (UPF0127 family)